MTLPDWINERAYFSDPQHRVWLRRHIGGPNGPAVFILHNPSKAGLEMDDPTSRKGISYAKRWGCSDLVFVNAVTAVATDARDLQKVEDIAGPMADTALEIAAAFCAANKGTLIAAWGAPKGTAFVRGYMERRCNAIEASDLPLHYLRLTKLGRPEHILYLPGDLTPRPWT